MASGLTYFEAPKGLQQRVRSAVLRSSRAKTPRMAWIWQINRFWRQALAPLAVVAVALLIALPIATRTANESRLVQEIVGAHVRSLMANHLMDVSSSDRHTVKPWFSGKLRFSPSVNDPAAEGFPLIGGRLDYVSNRPAAALVYQCRKHLINLFTWPSTRSAAVSERVLSQNGYNLIHWSQNGMEYWAVSDVNPGDLHKFVQLIRGQ
jgi:anti-sigma factor RsiW